MRRFVRTALMCVGLGVITTIAVAWGCALFIDVSQGRMAGSRRWIDVTHWSYWVFERPGALRVQRTVAPTVRAPRIEHGDETTNMHGPNQESDLELPRWSQVSEEQLGSDSILRGTYIEDARGWPWVSLRSETTVGHSDRSPLSATTAYRWGIPLGHAQAVSVLPLRPIWPEFLASALIYGMAWFILLIAPGMVRRVRRRLANRCMICDYDLHSLLSDRCPECGTER